jgi:hypothetical protein
LVNTDPFFTTTSIPTAPSTVGDYSLRSTSPAINAGSNDDYPDTWAKWQDKMGASLGLITDETAYNTYVKAALAKDRAGNNRIKNTTIDMGAYEY